jgi:ABC-type Fe3+ transport system permease subunit
MGDDTPSILRHSVSMLLTANDTHSPVAVPTVLIVAVLAGVVYGFGYLRAVMHRANKDYKTTKAAVPGLRKSFWQAWWQAVKIGALVFIAAVLLLGWAWREIRGNQAGADSPAPQPSTSVSRQGR